MTIAVTSELDNLIIGGDFNSNPWQRGVSFAAPTSGDYTADRFQYRKSGVQVFTVSKNTDNPSFAQMGLCDSFSLNVEVTTANATPGSGDFTTIEQPIEGFMAIPIFENSFGVSFWAKASVAGIYCLALQNDARDRNFIAEYTISTADTWEQFTFQITHEATGTWEIGNKAGLRVIFTLNAGGDFQGVADTWQAGNLLATSNQVNLSASVSNSLRIALVRCVHGVPGSAFYMRGQGRELMLAQRYYMKSYNIAVIPGTIDPSGNLSGFTTVMNTMISVLSESTKAQMRSVPTVTWYSPITGAINNIANITDAADIPITSTTDVGECHIGYPEAASTVSSNRLVKTHYTVEAEI